MTHAKHQSRVGPSSLVSQPEQSIIGCRIRHGWKEGNSPITHWKGTIVGQVPVNPSLYLIKYDGFDCVYGLEIKMKEFLHWKSSLIELQQLKSVMHT